MSPCQALFKKNYTPSTNNLLLLSQHLCPASPRPEANRGTQSPLPLAQFTPPPPRPGSGAAGSLTKKTTHLTYKVTVLNSFKHLCACAPSPRPQHRGTQSPLVQVQFTLPPPRPGSGAAGYPKKKILHLTDKVTVLNTTCAPRPRPQHRGIQSSLLAQFTPPPLRPGREVWRRRISKKNLHLTDKVTVLNTCAPRPRPQHRGIPQSLLA